MGASYLFYAVHDPSAVLLLTAVTFIGFTSALAIARARSPTMRRFAVFACTLALLGTLVWFKLLDASQAAGAPIPIGISFYTFQTLGYVLDVARGHIHPESTPTRFAGFVAFFPQLIAGPIERAETLVPQLRNPAAPTWQAWNRGWLLIAIGITKKTVFADNLRPIVAQICDHGGGSPLDLYTVGFAFMAQLYFDISAYTDVARGSARLLGIELSRNFAAPFLAPSPAAFWARWHQTVTQWFSNYLFPMLASRRTMGPRRVVAVIITMTATGLWHGLDGTFAVFGFIHGCWICASQWHHRVVRKFPHWKAFHRSNIATTLRWIGFLHGLAFTGLLFRAPSLSTWITWMHDASFASHHTSLSWRALALIVFGFISALIYQYIAERHPETDSWFRRSTSFRALVYVAMALTWLCVGTYHQQFVYDRF